MARLHNKRSMCKNQFNFHIQGKNNQISKYITSAIASKIWGLRCASDKL